MKRFLNEIVLWILLYILVFCVIYLIHRQNDIIIEQAYISIQIESLQQGNREIIERLNQPLILNNE